MALASARFRGNDRFERIAGGEEAQYLRFGDQGLEVTEIQGALIDRGFQIPDGATGYFGGQTSSAVVDYKTFEHLEYTDPVVGKGTLGKLDEFFCLPYADREEWLSWNTRLIPDWNFHRSNMLVREAMGVPFAFNPLCGPIPQMIRDAVANGITQLLSPRGSPDGLFMPSATWGVSPLDLFHVHIVVDHGMDPGWSQLKVTGERFHGRIVAMMNAARAATGADFTPEWTAFYRDLLLDPAPAGGGPGHVAQTCDFLNELVNFSFTVNEPLKFVWHTFERGRWRPAGMQSTDPRRSWWQVVSPVPGPVNSAPFTVHNFGDNVLSLFALGFVLDKFGTITLMAQDVIEAGAVVGLDNKTIEAAVSAP